MPMRTSTNDEPRTVPGKISTDGLGLAAAQRSFAQAHAASTCGPHRELNLRSTRRGSAGPANGRVSPAAKS